MLNNTPPPPPPHMSSISSAFRFFHHVLFLYQVYCIIKKEFFFNDLASFRELIGLSLPTIKYPRVPRGWNMLILGPSMWTPMCSPGPWPGYILTCLSTDLKSQYRSCTPQLVLELGEGKDSSVTQSAWKRQFDTELGHTFSHQISIDATSECSCM